MVEKAEIQNVSSKFTDDISKEGWVEKILGGATKTVKEFEDNKQAADC